MGEKQGEKQGGFYFGDEMRIKNLKIKIILLGLLTGLIIVSAKIALSAGINVWPGGMLIQNLPLGRAFDLDKERAIKLKISNSDEIDHTYVLSVYKPFAIGADMIGYLDLPDTSWFYFEKNEILVKAGGEGEVKMFIKIPGEDKYYNQRWAVSVGVEAKPEDKEMFTLACYPRFRIETESKEGLNEKPDGIIAFCPLAVYFNEASLQTKRIKSVSIFNNDSKEHLYKILALDRSSETAKRWISLSSGYSWIPQSNWIKLERSELVIPANSSARLNLTLNIPKEDLNYGRQWEEIFLVTPDGEKEGFFRVLVSTKEKEAQKR